MTLFVVVTCLAFLHQASILSATSIQETNNETNTLQYIPAFVGRPSNEIWVPLAFTGEKVTDLYIDPNLPGHAYVIVFLVGVFETYDWGDTWIQHFDVSSRAFDIAVHPTTLANMYLATWSSYGMYWTQNGGESWEGIPGWPSLSPQLYSVAVHPLTPTLMLAGSGNFEPVGGEIFKTTNGGRAVR
jgi:hypothetical protein